MSEDISFKIQLGVILPKMTETMEKNLLDITTELIGIVKAGTREGERLDITAVKEIVMKDLEIFLDDNIIPQVEKEIPTEDESNDEKDDAAEEEVTDTPGE
jgi:hypothetical protein